MSCTELPSPRRNALSRAGSFHPASSARVPKSIAYSATEREPCWIENSRSDASPRWFGRSKTHSNR